MIAVECKCGHRELDHDGRCSVASCGCTFYVPADESRMAALVAQLNAINPEDPEAAHDAADKVLLACVPAEIAAAYWALVARSPWWAAA